MSPPVSVLLPVYNGASYLPYAIESVLAQSYSDFELLISDDSSDDASPEIIDCYARLDRRISHWRNQSRLGLFANYNQCLKRASAKFIKPFAQDDVLDPAMLKETVGVLESHP